MMPVVSWSIIEIIYIIHFLRALFIAYEKNGSKFNIGLSTIASVWVWERQNVCVCVCVCVCVSVCAHVNESRWACLSSVITGRGSALLGLGTSRLSTDASWCDDKLWRPAAQLEPTPPTPPIPRHQTGRHQPPQHSHPQTTSSQPPPQKRKTPNCLCPAHALCSIALVVYSSSFVTERRYIRTTSGITLKAFVYKIRSFANLKGTALLSCEWWFESAVKQ